MGKNIGAISDRQVIGDCVRLSKFMGGKNALVAQGGGQRGIFTAGVLDAFNLSNFDPFDVYYGTSAGALNLCSFLCRQQGLGKAFITELTTDPSFFNLFSYIRKKQYVDLSWALERIVEFPYRLDLDMGRQVLGNREAYAAVTSSDKLIDHYLPIIQPNWREVLLATCAIPTLCPQPVEVSGMSYVDGGISASIPVQEAWRQGARFIAVIRTECIDEDGINGGDIELQIESPLVRPDEAKIRQYLNYIQTQWQQRLAQWRQDWSGYFRQRMSLAPREERLNGGRWLFGADHLYRMSHLIGGSFDTRLADMLMVHYQTYALTMEFLKRPPDDVFIVQIAPSQPLRSNTLLSRQSDLMQDYELGLEAGYNFIRSWEAARKQSGQPLETSKSGLLG
jgi:predicted patatin/cPLA2 family phospholipase